MPQSVPFTLILSVLSGGFGIAKFLKSGPCKIIPGDSGFLDGFVSLGFAGVILSVIATFVGKGLMLAVVAQDDQGMLDFFKAAMWMAFNWLPQFLYVSKVQLKLLQQLDIYTFLEALGATTFQGRQLFKGGNY